VRALRDNFCFGVLNEALQKVRRPEEQMNVALENNGVIT
jgi:hypothetical protein